MPISPRLRILETHERPATFRRLLGDGLLVAVGLIAWLAATHDGWDRLSVAAGIVGLLLASVLLLSGRNARLVREGLGSADLPTGPGLRLPTDSVSL